MGDWIQGGFCCMFLFRLDRGAWGINFALFLTKGIEMRLPPFCGDALKNCAR